jgi:hypothetical protein
MKISLAIPTFNRIDYTCQAFSEVLDIVDEVIIVDDCSEIGIFNELRNRLNSEKVHLYRNDVNLKPFRNKYNVVKKCKNEWVILLDSDNIIDQNYITTIMKESLNQRVMYCPEKLYTINNDAILYDYSKYSGQVINKTKAKQYIDDFTFQVCINTGNFFFNRDTYIKVVDNNELNVELEIADAIYMYYLWMKGDNSIKIVSNLNYRHRTHPGSYWMSVSPAYMKNTDTIIKTVKEEW